jgi:hypothetical protein
LRRTSRARHAHGENAANGALGMASAKRIPAIVSRRMDAFDRSGSRRDPPIHVDVPADGERLRCERCEQRQRTGRAGERASQIADPAGEDSQPHRRQASQSEGLAPAITDRRR